MAFRTEFRNIGVGVFISYIKFLNTLIILKLEIIEWCLGTHTQFYVFISGGKK